MIKLKELLKNYGQNINFCQDTIKPQKVECNNDSIIITYTPAGPIQDSYIDQEKNIIDYTLDLTGLLTPEANVELGCFWCYGNLPKEIFNSFQYAFKEKNYKKYRETLELCLYKEYHWCAPQRVSLNINGNILGDIPFIDEFLFLNLDFQESEQG